MSCQLIATVGNKAFDHIDEDVQSVIGFGKLLVSAHSSVDKGIDPGAGIFVEPNHNAFQRVIRLSAFACAS